ncbi:MAG TPA: proton-conducting transporter membrane subunit [Vicinamibacterales bacterium]|nr:proton-conducting transporter membrane subunit [Vicinamibacterales bacterium]
MNATALAPLFWAMCGGFAMAAAGALAPAPRVARAVTAIGSVAGAAAGLWLACLVLAGAGTVSIGMPSVLAAAGGLSFHLDRLGAVFLAVIGGVTIPVAIYGFGYTGGYGSRYSMRWMSLQTGVFLLSMSLVVSAANVLTFLLAWELMAVTSWLLVITEHDRPDAVRGGLWYLAMTHMGLLALLAAFFLLGGDQAGAWPFDALRDSAASLPPGTRNAIFLLALLGFGSKAGLVPVHVWLPRAHPAAPSHVSALMSAVMVKLGIYGLLRVALDLLGGGPAWWGVLLVAAGAVTALTGVLYALVDDDLKRLLAYSTVENVGLIVLGTGAGFLFLSLAQPTAAALAFAAALLHVVNHAAFKGVLFLGAGAVLHATGERDINRLGGLVKRTPWTAATFLVGALSIAALPPFNGFVSEWLLFQSFLPGVASSRASVAVLLTLGVGALALTGGLAAATFVKAFGISFLAMPRSPEAANAHEAGWAMRAGMVILALACPALAILTVPVLSAIGGALGGVGGLPAASTTFSLGVILETPHGLARMSPVVIMAVLAAAGIGVWLATRLVSRGSRRIDDTWGCGRIGQTPRMEYTSTAFAEPLRRIFGELYRPTDDLTVTEQPGSPYHIQTITYRTQLHPWFERGIYDPLVRATQAAASRVRALQSGSINAYLAYIVLVLVVLLGMVIGF